MDAKITITIPDERLRELDAMRERLGIKTLRELLNNALTVLEWAVEQSARGREIASVNAEGESYQPLDMPILSAARGKPCEKWCKGPIERMGVDADCLYPGTCEVDAAKSKLEIGVVRPTFPRATSQPLGTEDWVIDVPYLKHLRHHIGQKFGVTAYEFDLEQIEQLLLALETFGEVAAGARSPNVEDDARARGPESARSSHGAAEHAPSAEPGDSPSSPTNTEFGVGASQIEALEAADAVLRHCPEISTNNMGTTVNMTTRRAEIRGEESPHDVQRAKYALSLIGVLERRCSETGALDDALADRIESVLWPTK